MYDESAGRPDILQDPPAAPGRGIRHALSRLVRRKSSVEPKGNGPLLNADLAAKSFV